MEKILLLVMREMGHPREKLERYKDAIEANTLSMDLPPALAYFALDSCSLHDPYTITNWLHLSTKRLGRDRQGTSARLRYIEGLRRRALKVRPDWPEKRFQWTNQINRAKHYAEKLL